MFSHIIEESFNTKILEWNVEFDKVFFCPCI